MRWSHAVQHSFIFCGNPRDLHPTSLAYAMNRKKASLMIEPGTMSFSSKLHIHKQQIKNAIFCRHLERCFHRFFVRSSFCICIKFSSIISDSEGIQVIIEKYVILVCYPSPSMANFLCLMGYCREITFQNC